MHNYEEKILTMLVELYRKSKKDSKTSVINRRTQIKPTKLYVGYYRNDGDLDEINGINETVARLQEKGYLTYEMKGFSNEIAAIYLIDSQVEEAEQYLTEKYGYQSKHEKMKQVEEIITRYKGYSPVADIECAKLRESLDKNIVPKNYEKTAEVLKALVFIERNERMLYVREASMLIYGSSKYFEEVTMDTVCGLLRKYHERPCQENELLNEILGEYHIATEEQKICLKGNIVLVKHARTIELGEFRNGIEFYADELNGIESILVRDSRFITVENKTSYMRCHEEDTSYFYLGGYANRFQREFLKKIFADNPQITYLHFGDIDAGGFYIHENLCRISGIPFGLWRMSKKELQDMRYTDCLLKLTVSDRKRLKMLAEHEMYRDVAQYMLDEGVKLEQEIVSLLAGEPLEDGFRQIVRRRCIGDGEK